VKKPLDEVHSPY